jgi:ribonuclease BN (tRNA processing enzyme)
MPQIFTNDELREKKIFVPKSSLNSLLKYQRSSHELNYPKTISMTDEEFVNYVNIKYIPVEPKLIITEFELNQNSLNIHIPYQIEILKAYHNVDSVGYGFSENKTVLKKEIKDILTDNNVQNALLMKSLREKKIEINEIQQIPSFAFYCDSQILNLSKHDEWKKYPVIICECTGLNSTENDKNIYHERYHTCITQLLPIMKEFIDKRWILIHISMWLSVEQIIEIETKLKNDGFDISIVCDKR